MRPQKQARKERAAKRVKGLIEEAATGVISVGQREHILKKASTELTEEQIIARAQKNLKHQLQELTA